MKKETTRPFLMLGKRVVSTVMIAALKPFCQSRFGNENLCRDDPLERLQRLIKKETTHRVVSIIVIVDWGVCLTSPISSSSYLSQHHLPGVYRNKHPKPYSERATLLCMYRRSAVRSPIPVPAFQLHQIS